MNPLAGGFTTGEENYVAVVAFLSRLYPHVANLEAREAMKAIMKEMCNIYPTIFKYEEIEGRPTILMVPEGPKR